MASSSRLPIPSTYRQPESDLSHTFTDTQVEEYKEQDRYLPIANVARIMKDSLPVGAKISKESKECLQECVSEFIMFITSEASERCDQNKRKTIHGEDILEAMEALGFDNYVEVLRIYLAKYRMSQRDKPKRASKASSTAAAAAAASASSSKKKRPRDPEDEDEAEEEGEEEEGE